MASCPPLLANIYLHAFDTAFHEPDGPAQFADARLVRYADDFVVLARKLGPQVEQWIEGKLETELGLSLNREKTRTVRLGERGVSLDFLGFTFRYDRDRYGRSSRYLNVFPSAKSTARLREKIRGLMKQTHVWIVQMCRDVSRLLRAWRQYFDYGYPRQAFRDLNYHVVLKFQRFLKSKSHRRARPTRRGESLYRGIRRLGFVPL